MKKRRSTASGGCTMGTKCKGCTINVQTHHKKEKKKAAHQNFQTRAYEKETRVSGIMGMTCLRAI